MTTNVSKLGNGLKIATRSMPHATTLSIGIWVNAGARDETAKEQGIAHMLEAISDTAELGAYSAIEELDDETLRTKLRNILSYIQTGAFASDMINQNIKHTRDDFKSSEIEKIGKEIRSFMPKGTDG